jgi:hypothetical protein
MGRTNAAMLAVLFTCCSLAALGATQADADRETLARQIERRFDVLPVQAGVVLRPKSPNRAVRSIELANGGIAIDGEAVTGAEVQRRLGDAAEMILRLSYLTPSEQRALFEPSSAPPTATSTPEAAGPPGEPSQSPASPGPRRSRRSDRGSDRVRIGGGIVVGPDESIEGSVVAVGGGADIQGRVRDDVVAIGGGITLGPRADVQGDVTVIGGPLRRDPASRVGGEIHEVGLGDVNFWPAWRRMWPPFRGQSGELFGSGLGSVFALVFTLTRLGVLCILASIVLLFGREYVERVSLRAASQPLKAGMVGFLIQLLFVPLLLATIFVMVITIVGIPLLLLIPFAILAFALLFLIGFTAVVYDVGRLVASRLGPEGRSPYLIAAMGIAVVLSPALISRLIGLTGSMVWPITWTLLALGVFTEYLVWTVGLGAIALVRFDRQQPAI